MPSEVHLPSTLVLVASSPPRYAWQLYAGRAMSIYGRIQSGVPLAITLRGRLASGQLWQTRLNLPENLAQRSGAATPFPSSPPPTPAPFVRLVQLILTEAIALRATHVILRPQYNTICVIYVIHGVEVHRDSVSGKLKAALVTRFKVLCNLDITATKPQQSGRCPVTINGQHQTCDAHFRETSERTSVLIDFVSLPIDQTADPIKAWWTQP